MTKNRKRWRAMTRLSHLLAALLKQGRRTEPPSPKQADKITPDDAFVQRGEDQ